MAAALLGLPKPLKERIYTYALVADRPLDLCGKPFRTQYALLNTSTQVRDEASAIFYSKNVFIVSDVMSQSLNLVKNADGTVMKLQIAFTISADVRKRCKFDPKAILKLLTRRVESLPAFLLGWGPTADGREIVEPTKATFRHASDRRIISALNKIFREQLLEASKPFATAMRKVVRKKMDDFVERENKANGKEDKVGLKGEDLSMRAARDLNGGEKFGLGGAAVDSTKLLANLSIEEHREFSKDFRDELNFVPRGKENGTTAGKVQKS